VTGARDLAWDALARAAAAARGGDGVATDDAGRFVALRALAAGIWLDYSRQQVTSAQLDALFALADAVELRGAIAAMFAGATVNRSEGRAALHVALRQPAGAAIGGAEVARQVFAERSRMLGFAERVRSGAVRGASGEPFRTVVNIGIGGSDLGPAMAVEALRHHARGAPRVCFVSNVDGCGLADVLEGADPATTLFIVASKTFSTQETMSNARLARDWLATRMGEGAVPAHFAAVSVNAAAMDAFGVHPDHRFAMWDWVGGRYSIWSSIGVSLAIVIGAPAFEAMLAGGHEMDLAFRDRPWRDNPPALMALLGVWNINFLGLPTLAVLPYDSRLARFPAYLQQLDMESNGKSVGVDGAALRWETAPVVWGEPGNNAQHSFFQLLHQGTRRAALDMLLPARSSCGNEPSHALAIANCLAQAEVFMKGRRGEGVPPERVHAGGRPLSLLMFERLEPRTLGALIALYEHKVYAQSVVWGINAFDQWGVELGKRVAEDVRGMLAEGAAGAPASLGPALELLRRWRG
jgi:glucose-6-phosphate isomerase